MCNYSNFNVSLMLDGHVAYFVDRKDIIFIHQRYYVSLYALSMEL